MTVFMYARPHKVLSNIWDNLLLKSLFSYLKGVMRLDGVLDFISTLAPKGPRTDNENIDE